MGMSENNKNERNNKEVLRRVREGRENILNDPLLLTVSLMIEVSKLKMLPG